jgi:hypothetical protein
MTLGEGGNPFIEQTGVEGKQTKKTTTIVVPEGWKHSDEDISFDIHVSQLTRQELVERQEELTDLVAGNMVYDIDLFFWNEYERHQRSNKTEVQIGLELLARQNAELNSINEALKPG